MESQQRTSSASKILQVRAELEARQQQIRDETTKSPQAGAMVEAQQRTGMSAAKTLQLHAVLLVMQLGFAGHQVLTRVALTSGLSQFVYTIYRSGIALLLMGPFAYFLEKKQRPPITGKLLFRFSLLGLAGIVGSQQLFLVGLMYTSATFAATIQNAIPMFTFLLALMLGIEKVRFNRLDGKAKLLGTAVCIIGAVLMCVWRGPAVIEGWKDQEDREDKDVHVKALLGQWLGSQVLRFPIDMYRVGSICLLLNCLSWAVYFVMLAPTLQVFPAPLTITAFMYIFGSFQVGILLLVFTGGKVSWTIPWGPQLYSILYAGAVSSGINLYIQSWAIQRGGPLLVSLYTPVQTIITAILSVVLLGDSWYLGSMVGGLAAVAGLYLVTWGQVEHRRQDLLEDASLVFEDEETAHEDVHLPYSSSDSEITHPLLVGALERQQSADQGSLPSPINVPTLQRRPSFYDRGEHSGSFTPHHLN